MYVRPAPGLVIHDPDLKTDLPAEGRDVPDTRYWRRLLRDGNVLLQAAVRDEGAN